jgi:hypothetical protein
MLPLLVSMNRVVGEFLARGGTSQQTTVQNLTEKQLVREAQLSPLVPKLLAVLLPRLLREIS